MNQEVTSSNNQAGIDEMSQLQNQSNNISRFESSEVDVPSQTLTTWPVEKKMPMQQSDYAGYDQNVQAVEQRLVDSRHVIGATGSRNRDPNGEPILEYQNEYHTNMNVTKNTEPMSQMQSS